MGNLRERTYSYIAEIENFNLCQFPGLHDEMVEFFRKRLTSQKTYIGSDNFDFTGDEEKELVIIVHCKDGQGLQVKDPDTGIEFQFVVMVNEYGVDCDIEGRPLRDYRPLANTPPPA